MSIDFTNYPLPRRIRHHTKPILYHAHNVLKNVGSEYPPLIEKMVWQHIFSNGHPTDALDIGCGKGSLLLNYALEHPNENILGIEVREVLASWLNDIIKSEGIGNCHAIWYSVANGLPFIQDNSINKVFYLFPDPWPKRKHIKRRAFNEEFLDEIARILKKSVQDIRYFENIGCLSGELYIATDVPEIDEYHRKILVKSGKFDYKYITSDEDWELPVTNKEKFCREVGIPYSRMLCNVK